MVYILIMETQNNTTTIWTTTISWKTSKAANGRFVATVYAFGYQVPTVTLGTYTRTTRAQAVGAAKQAARYFKAAEAR